MSWHERSCGIPDLSWAGGYPTCIRCGSSASYIAKGSVVTPPPPVPPPCPKRSQLVCSWPPCVEYSDSYIDENGNDITAFITENIDTWNIDQAELPDDQANIEEIREASQQTGGNTEVAGLSRAFPNTTNTNTSDGVSQTMYGEIQMVALGPTPMHHSDRIHEPLSGFDDFRLLRLHGSASFDAPIHCSLEVAQLDDPDVPLYEALSYTWADLDGNKQNCVPIYVGRHFDVLFVTKNCKSALWRLRKSTDRLLWIDAICINQNNLHERTEQVKHMAEIYSRASRVLIYLGETSTRSAEAFTMVTTCPQTSVIWNDTAFLVELAKRPYFKRLWIIQEVGLAPRASVIYGAFLMHWTDLCSAFGSCGAGPAWIKHFSAPVHQRRLTPSVLELLRDTKEALCIDPRDKLFGIIGLASTTERQLLPIDYSLSTQLLYTGLAAYWVQKTGDHSFINFAGGHRKTIPGLPSWVPDWTDIGTQDIGATMPELLVGSTYAPFPRLYWKRREHKFCFPNRFLDPSHSALFSKSDEVHTLMSPPLVQHIAGALLVYAVPLFRISRSKLMPHGVASVVRVTNWRMGLDAKLFDRTEELEIFEIPAWNCSVVLKRHTAGIFSLQGCVSMLLNTVPLLSSKLDTIHTEIYNAIVDSEIDNIKRWLLVVLGLHLSSELASQDSAENESAHEGAVFPDIPGLVYQEESFRAEYQKSNQLGFNSGHFEAMDLMRSIMIDAINSKSLASIYGTPSDPYFPDPPSIFQYKIEMLTEELPARQRSIDEQISTWSLSVAQLRSQLQEQGSFSDAFRDVDMHFLSLPAWDLGLFKPIHNLVIQFLGASGVLKGLDLKLTHMSVFLAQAYSVILRATLDENLPWNYNRDRFWMCIVSFDLIVRARLLLADRQVYDQMDHSIRSSMKNPKRIVIV